MRNAAAALLLAAALCPAPPAAAVEPIQNYENVAVRGARGATTAEQVRDAIIDGAERRQWEVDEDGDGRLVASRRVRDRYEIEVLITYDARRYSLVYKSSLNLSYRAAEGTIHPRYNQWVRELAASINLSLRRIRSEPDPQPAAEATAAPPADPTMPQAGDTWTYRLTDPVRRDAAERSYVVTVAAASEEEVVDRVALGGAAAVEQRHGRSAELLAPSSGIFSPYLLAFRKTATPAALPIGLADPACGGQYVCEVRGYVVGEEAVSVAAGKFEATKVVIEQSWRPAFPGAAVKPGSRVLTVWYSPATKRAVKYSSRLAYGDTPPMHADFDLELASYRFGAGAARVIAAPRPPEIGDNWTYRVSDPKKAQRARTVFVKVASVSPALIVEHVSVEGGFTMPWRHARGAYLVPQGVSVLSPYLPQFEKMAVGEAIGYIESADPGCRGLFVCQAKGTVVGEETVDTAAGRFKAIKVEVQQTWRPAAGASKDQKELARMHGSRTLTIWYAGDLKRAVRYQSRLNSGDRVPIEANYDLELVSYQVK